jgi:hypothetical protein
MGQAWLARIVEPAAPPGSGEPTPAGGPAARRARNERDGVVPLRAMAPTDPSHTEAALPIPIDGTLDLHTFAPREVKELVPEYLRACRARGILEVRIVHGKGTGALRRQVHALLGRLPEVEGFALAGESGGGWGATLVSLRPAAPTSTDG